MTLPDYNAKFLQNVGGNQLVPNNATPYGVQIEPISENEAEGAQHYWRVVGIHHLTGAENMGNHHVYADVLDEHGQRVNGSRLILTQGTSNPLFAVIDKPPNEAGTNFPMWSSTRATVAVEDVLPSEGVSGLRTDHADEDTGNTWGHHSFYTVFQKTPIPATPEPPPPEEPEEPVGPVLSLEETIAQVGQPLIIPLNPDAAFYKIAQQQNLGERLTSEYDAGHGGKSYRAQIYEKGIVYAEIGDWGNVKIIPRTN